MKKITLLVLAIGLAFASCTTKKTYQIAGTVDSLTNLDGQIVYLGESFSSIVDSTTIADGKFVFNGTASDTAKLFLVFTQERPGVSFVLEAGNIAIDFPEGAATGTPLNDEFQQYKDAKEGLSKDFMTLMNEVESDSTSTRTDEEKRELLQGEYDKMVQKIIAVSVACFEKHTNDVVGASAFLDVLSSPDPDMEQLMALRAKAGDIVLNTAGVKESLEMADNLANTQVGKMFVDFEGLDTDSNEAVSLSKYVGQGDYALVDFWASWCGPCRGEIPHIANAYNKFKDKGLKVIGAVVWDKLDAHQSAKESLKVVWPQIFDNTEGGKELATKYGIRGIPEVILFAPDGTIVARSLRGEEMLNKLAEVYAAN